MLQYVVGDYVALKSVSSCMELQILPLDDFTLFCCYPYQHCYT